MRFLTPGVLPSCPAVIYTIGKKTLRIPPRTARNHYIPKKGKVKYLWFFNYTLYFKGLIFAK